MALSDPFFAGIAARIRWCIQDMNRNELKKIDNQYDLKRLLLVLVKLRYLSKAEMHAAKRFNGNRLPSAHVPVLRK